MLGAVTSPEVIRFLSTLSLRRATARLRRSASIWLISIHALLAESDFVRLALFALGVLISIHALLAESDSSKIIMLVFGLEFLSTLSLRRATAL